MMMFLSGNILRFLNLFFIFQIVNQVEPVAATSLSPIPGAATSLSPIPGAATSLSQFREMRFPNRVFPGSAVSQPRITQDTLKASIHPPDQIQRDTVLQNQIKSDTLLQSGTAGEEVPPVNLIDFKINEKVTYLLESMFRVPEALNKYQKANRNSLLLDSLLKLTSELRDQYHSEMNPAKRDSLADKIRNLEQRNFSLKSEINEDFFESRLMELNWWKEASYIAFERHTHVTDSIKEARNKLKSDLNLLLSKEKITARDSTLADSSKVQNVIQRSDSIIQKEDSVIYYKIQLGAFGKTIPAQKKVIFDRISKLRPIDTYPDEKGNTVYTTGNLRNWNDAVRLQTQVRQEGIKDAFIIAFQNGKRVSLPLKK